MADMSDYEPHARYEHATTFLDWRLTDAAPPVLAPPTDDPGWMLLSQTPPVSMGEFGVVHRILCTWRRRLEKAKPEPKPKPETTPRTPATRQGAPTRGKAPSDPPAPDDGEESDEEIARRFGCGK